MKCDRCKEELDDRDVLEKKTLHCWRCGFKRPLSDSEKRSLYEDEGDWPPYNMYTYEV